MCSSRREAAAAKRRKTAILLPRNMPGGQTDSIRQNTPHFFRKDQHMAEDITTTQPAGEQQSVQVVLDERELKIIFSNAYRIHTTAEEIVIDLGFNMPDPNPQGNQQRLLFKVTDRVVM